MSRRQRPRAPLSADEPGSAGYEVGYGRPPHASRFKPGQCGNPKGRPRKPKNLNDAVERELDRIVVVREGGREKRLTKREVMSRQLVDASCRGQLGATRLLLREMSGTAAAEAALSSNLMPASAHPIDTTDRQIIASFAAMIRAGAQIDPTAALNARADDDDDADASDESGPQRQGLGASPPSPTCH
ncbi:protein of unknown function [Methylorubrum extorquens]|uniref:DUF5681 domain-containing protein n=1 Tax=Methylorubrum extorquens TaxID=408 RepID=A0A2N9AXE1_METEX|nr:protein of unknown function [Methylorubrum extorquens]